MHGEQRDDRMLSSNPLRAVQDVNNLYNTVSQPLVAMYPDVNRNRSADYGVDGQTVQRHAALSRYGSDVCQIEVHIGIRLVYSSLYVSRIGAKRTISRRSSSCTLNKLPMHCSLFTNY